MSAAEASRWGDQALPRNSTDTAGQPRQKRIRPSELLRPWTALYKASPLPSMDAQPPQASGSAAAPEILCKCSSKCTLVHQQETRVLITVYSSTFNFSHINYTYSTFQDEERKWQKLILNI